MYTKDINLASVDEAVEGEYVIRLGSFIIPQGAEYNINSVYMPYPDKKIEIENDYLVVFAGDGLSDDLATKIQIEDGLYNKRGLSGAVDRALNQIMSVTGFVGITTEANVDEVEGKLQIRLDQYDFQVVEPDDLSTDFDIDYDEQTGTWSTTADVGYIITKDLPKSKGQVSLVAGAPNDIVTLNLIDNRTDGLDPTYILEQRGNQYKYSTAGDGGLTAMATVPAQGDVMRIQWEWSENNLLEATMRFQIVRGGTVVEQVTATISNWYSGLNEFTRAQVVLEDGTSTFSNFQTYIKVPYDIKGYRIISTIPTANKLGLVGRISANPTVGAGNLNVDEVVFTEIDASGNAKTKDPDASYNIPAVMINIPEFGLTNLDNGFGTNPDQAERRSIAVSIPKNFIDPLTNIISYQPYVNWKKIDSAIAEAKSIDKLTVQVFVDGIASQTIAGKIWINMTIRSTEPFEISSPPKAYSNALEFSEQSSTEVKPLEEVRSLQS